MYMYMYVNCTNKRMHIHLLSDYRDDPEDIYEAPPEPPSDTPVPPISRP